MRAHRKISPTITVTQTQHIRTLPTTQGNASLRSFASWRFSSHMSISAPKDAKLRQASPSRTRKSASLAYLPVVERKTSAVREEPTTCESRGHR